MSDVISWNGITLPLLNEYVILLDTTRMGAGQDVANSTTLVSTAGNWRYMADGARIEGVIGSTGQDVTFVRQTWNGSAWETVANTTEINGSQTLTAGTTYPVRWVPPTPDYRMYLLAGGTAPTTVISNWMMIRGDRAAVS